MKEVAQHPLVRQRLEEAARHIEDGTIKVAEAWVNSNDKYADRRLLLLRNKLMDIQNEIADEYAKAGRGE